MVFRCMYRQGYKTLLPLIIADTNKTTAIVQKMVEAVLIQGQLCGFFNIYNLQLRHLISYARHAVLAQRS
jgi:hypothetical protein